MANEYPSNPADRAANDVIPQLHKVRFFGNQAVCLPEKTLTADGQLFFKTMVVGQPNVEGIMFTADVHFAWPNGDQVTEINGTVTATRPSIKRARFHYDQGPSQTRCFIDTELLEREIMKAVTAVGG